MPITINSSDAYVFNVAPSGEPITETNLEVVSYGYGDGNILKWIDVLDTDKQTVTRYTTTCQEDTVYILWKGAMIWTDISAKRLEVGGEGWDQVTDELGLRIFTKAFRWTNNSYSNNFDTKQFLMGTENTSGDTEVLYKINGIQLKQYIAYWLLSVYKFDVASTQHGPETQLTGRLFGTADNAVKADKADIYAVQSGDTGHPSTIAVGNGNSFGRECELGISENSLNTRIKTDDMEHGMVNLLGYTGGPPSGYNFATPRITPITYNADTNDLSNGDDVYPTLNQVLTVTGKYITNAQGKSFANLEELNVRANWYYAGRQINESTVPALSENDYCFVRVVEVDNLQRSARYIYSGGSWKYQYSFSGLAVNDDQLDALISGANSQNINKLKDYINGGDMPIKGLGQILISDTAISIADKTTYFAGKTESPANYRLEFGAEYLVYFKYGLTDGTITGQVYITIFNNRYPVYYNSRNTLKHYCFCKPGFYVFRYVQTHFELRCIDEYAAISNEDAVDYGGKIITVSSKAKEGLFECYIKGSFRINGSYYVEFQNNYGLEVSLTFAFPVNSYPLDYGNNFIKTFIYIRPEYGYGNKGQAIIFPENLQELLVNNSDYASHLGTSSANYTKTTLDNTLAGKLNTDGSNGTSAGVSALINKLTVGTADPQDGDYYVSQYAGGGSTTATYRRRPLSALWNWIKGKISSVLGLTASTYGGTADKSRTASQIFWSANPYNAINRTASLPGGNPSNFTLQNGATYMIHFENMFAWGASDATMTMDICNTGAKKCYVSSSNYEYSNRMATLGNTILCFQYFSNLDSGRGGFRVFQNRYVDAFNGDTHIGIYGNISKSGVVSIDVVGVWQAGTTCNLYSLTTGESVQCKKRLNGSDSGRYANNGEGNLMNLLSIYTENGIKYVDLITKIVPITSQGAANTFLMSNGVGAGNPMKWTGVTGATGLLGKQFTTGYSAVNEPDHILCLAKDWAAAGYMSKNNFINWIRGKISAPTSINTDGNDYGSFSLPAKSTAILSVTTYNGGSLYFSSTSNVYVNGASVSGSVSLSFGKQITVINQNSYSVTVSVQGNGGATLAGVIA